MKSRLFILFLIAGWLGLLLAVSPSSGKEVGDRIISLAFSPDSKMLAVADADDHGRTSVKLWDVRSLQFLSTINVSNLTSLGFSPDGKLLAVGGSNCTIWQLASQRSIVTLNDHTSAVAFSPDGRLIARTVGHPASAIQLWDLQNQQEVALLSAEGIWTRVSSNLAFSPDGKLLAAGYGLWGRGSWGRVMIWDIGNIEKPQVSRILAPASLVMSVTFSSDGKLLAVGGLIQPHHRVLIWDVKTQTEVAKLEGHTWRVDSVTFSSDRRILVSAENDLAVIWDVEQRKQIDSLSGRPHQSLLPIALSPDGRWLANTAIGERTLDDNEIFLWRMPDSLGGATTVNIEPTGKLTTSWGSIKKTF